MGGAKVHLHALGFGPWLVAELNQSHQHGQTQASNKDVEDPGHIGQAQSLGRLVLKTRGMGVEEGQKAREGMETGDWAKTGNNTQEMEW